MNTYFLVKQTLGKKACLGIQNLLLRAQNINFLLEDLNFFQLQQSLEFSDFVFPFVIRDSHILFYLRWKELPAVLLFL